MKDGELVTASRIRRIILEQSRRANVGHIGSALSIADIVAALYGQVFAGLDPDDPNRDRFVVSKGHAVLAVYAADDLTHIVSVVIDGPCNWHGRRQRVDL